MPEPRFNTPAAAPGGGETRETDLMERAADALLEYDDALCGIAGQIARKERLTREDGWDLVEQLREKHGVRALNDELRHPRPAAVSAPAGEATVDRAKAAQCPACGAACFVDVGGALCDYRTALFHACAIQEDVAAILRALGLSDHARPVSAHAVVHDEILPAIAALRQGSHAGH